MSGHLLDQKKAQRTFHVYSWTAAAVFAGILMALNFIVGFFPARLDTSEGGAYSLSKGTKQLLRSLDDTLLVRLVFSSKLPPPYSLNEKYIRDLLSECKKASGGKLRVEFVDPNKSDRDKDRAMRDGVQPVELDVRTRDKIEVQACFMGLSFQFGDKKESIPFVQNTTGLEYEIAQKIKRLTANEKPAVGFVTSANSMDFSGEALAPIKSQLEELYSIQNVDLGASAIPGGLKSLWVVRPTAEFSALELAQLKVWLEGGGSLALLIDRRQVVVRDFASNSLRTGLEDFLGGYGIDFPDGFVLDRKADRIQIRSIRGSIQMINMVEYPYFPLVVDLDRSHPATKDIANFSMPFVSPLIVEKPVPGLTYTPLARSSKYSWLDASPTDLAPFSQKMKPSDAKEGPFNLILLVEGNFSAEQGADKKPGRLIVSGTSRFVQPDFAGRQENFTLFFNLLDWSAQDEILLSIRSKGTAHRPLKQLPETLQFLVKSALMFFMPFLAIIVGLVVWRRQKLRRRFLPLIYRGV